MIAIVPLLVIVTTVWRFGINVPYWDEYQFAPVVEKLFTSQTLGFGDLISQHNEHRPFFPRLVILALAKVTHWNVLYELYASVAFIGISISFLWNLLQRTFRGDLFGKSLAVIFSFLLFSKVQGTNFIWGWQLCWFLANLFVIVSVWGWVRWPGRWLGISIAALGAFAATFSVANGLVAWIIGAFTFLPKRNNWRFSHKVFWGGAFLCSATFYFWRYHSVSYHPSLLSFIDHPFSFVLFVLACLGSPFGFFSGLKISAAYSIFIVVVAISSAYYLRQYKSSSISKMIPWLQLTFYGVFGAILIGLGRFGSGIEQALASRYAITSIIFWVGTLALSTMGLRLFLKQFSSVRGLMKSAIGLLCVVFILGYIYSARKGAEEIEWFSGMLEVNQYTLYEYKRASNSELQMVFISTAFVRQEASKLESLHIGPFVNGTGEENSNRIRKQWVQNVESEQLVRTTFPSRLFSLKKGYSKASSENTDALTFVVEKEGVTFYLNSAKFSAQPIVILDIQSKSATYAVVYWNTGDGLSEREKSIVSGLHFEGETKEFWVQALPDIKGFRVDLHYLNELPISDSLKIDAYTKK